MKTWKQKNCNLDNTIQAFKITIVVLPTLTKSKNPDIQFLCLYQSIKTKNNQTSLVIVYRMTSNNRSNIMFIKSHSWSPQRCSSLDHDSFVRRHGYFVFLLYYYVAFYFTANYFAGNLHPYSKTVYLVHFCL